jgi:predicted cupin superfamily sugar epimerase
LRSVKPTAADLKQTLGLEPHPTCGFVREAYRSEEAIPEAALPGFAGERRRASVLYFLVTPDAHIALHRIKPTQMYHHYLGDPLEVLLLYEDGTGTIETVGSLADGLSPQLLIPGQTWHASWLPAERDYAMLATTEWPAVEPDDVEVGDATRLTEDYPAFADALERFARRPEAAPLRAGIPS